ncbi:hypothetical protein GCM10018793_35870 [Streptomyces sulfonofaciens]|uniref:Uncharacterized protein n=1 Tax=Streptomyces sulfonofaciens TaxID=68272 RepID=A0A919L2M1_9ACTN|nr:hypothetical protein [Streptomyces sulfonofaciens]GHH80546.1 hypothetical protein GCM10018793_35870 [Streptomyces sulfonofaciens]
MFQMFQFSVYRTREADLIRAAERRRLLRAAREARRESRAGGASEAGRAGRADRRARRTAGREPEGGARSTTCAGSPRARSV